MDWLSAEGKGFIIKEKKREKKKGLMYDFVDRFIIHVHV